MDCAPSFINLPVKLIYLIMKKLLFADKVSLAEADPKFAEIFVIHFREEYTNINPVYLPVRLWSNIIPLCSFQVSHIQRTFRPRELVPYKSIVGYWHHLETIQIFVDASNKRDIVSLLQNKKSLKTVHLYIHNECIRFRDTLYALMALPKLTELLLYGLDAYHVPLLQYLEGLKVLSLTSRGADPIDIFQICSRLINLRSLHLSNLNIARSGFEQTFCQKLEKLEICHCYISAQAPYFPYLRQLKVFCSHFDYQNHFYSWLLAQHNTLEVLEIFFPAHQRFWEIHFLETMKSCYRLQELRLHNIVSKYFMASLIKILMENGRAYGKPLELWCKNSEELSMELCQLPNNGLIYMRGLNEYKEDSNRTILLQYPIPDNVTSQCCQPIRFLNVHS